jgi:CheY-like chemotaxis protein
VRVASGGAAALEMTKTYTPDVVFLDLDMPGKDGYEVARRLRQQPALDRVVLTALTGWGQQEDRRRTAEAGFDHHLVKPPEPKALEDVLAGLAGPARRRYNQQTILHSSRWRVAPSAAPRWCGGPGEPLSCWRKDMMKLCESLGGG